MDLFDIPSQTKKKRRRRKIMFICGGRGGGGIQRHAERTGETRNGYQISYSQSCELPSMGFGKVIFLEDYAFLTTEFCPTSHLFLKNSNFQLWIVESWICQWDSITKRVKTSTNNWPGLQGGNPPSILQFISEMMREKPSLLCDISSYIFMKCLPLENHVGAMWEKQGSSLLPGYTRSIRRVT